MKLNEYNAYELSEMLRNGKCSTNEVLSDTLRCAYEKQSDINSYITINDKTDTASKIDLKNRYGSSLLDGIPVAVKDNSSTK